MTELWLLTGSDIVSLQVWALEKKISHKIIHILAFSLLQLCQLDAEVSSREL